MNITVAAKAGFCFGVKRALDLVEQVVRDESEPVHTLGPLIHNPRVVRDLEANGVHVASRPDEPTSGVLVLRSHGATPEEVAAAEQAGLRVVDATCPCLKRAQKKAVELCDAGYDVVLLGEREHAEVRATLGITGGRARVVEAASEIEHLHLGRKVALISQTTQRFETFGELALALLARVNELLIANTICDATSERQNAAALLARNVDVMIVVGGRNSANTARLAEICRATGTTTYHIEEASELQPEWFQGVGKVGLTAGASTPQAQIEEVVGRMKEFGEHAPGMENHDEKEPAFNPDDAYNHDVRRLEEGEVIRAVVVEVRDDMIFVDVGTKSELPIPLTELTSRDVRSAREIVSRGDEIDVLVMRAGDEEKISLSAKRAEQERRWVELEKAFREKTPVTGTVKEVVKGGLMVEIGGSVRAFTPASQIARGFTDNLNNFVGQTFDFRIIELETGHRNKKRVVLSRRVILDEDYNRAKTSVYSELQPGDVKEGRVSRIADFGAFVDLGNGVEGLLHVSEISWERINHPSERLQTGMPVRVEVTKVDPERERISLSLRTLTPHPWAQIAEKFQVGAVVEGVVTRITPFGAFARIADGVEGLIHVSQLADRRVSKPEEIVSVGQAIHAKIIRVDSDSRKISLSLREAQQDEEEKDYRQYMNPETKPVTVGDVLKEKSVENDG